MTRPEDTPIARLAIILQDFTRAALVAAIIFGASFLCGVLEVLIHRSFP